MTAEETGGTQSCPDPHFDIDTKRLLPALERMAPGQTTSRGIADRQLAELVKEAGIVVSTTQLSLEQPQPRMDRRAWTAAVDKAIAPCTAGRDAEARE